MDNLSTVDKLPGPKLSFIERFHCSYKSLYQYSRGYDSPEIDFVRKCQLKSVALNHVHTRSDAIDIVSSIAIGLESLLTPAMFLVLQLVASCLFFSGELHPAKNGALSEGR